MAKLRVAVVPLLVVLTACGGAPADFGAQQPGKANTAEPLIAVSGTPTPTPVERLNRVTFSKEIAAALAKQTSWRLSNSLRDGRETMLSTTGVRTSKPFAMSVQVSGTDVGGQAIKLVVAGNLVYASIPGTTPAGKYVRFKPGQLKEVDALLENADPAKLVRSMESAIKAVRFVREQMVDGVPVERYAVTVSTAKVAALGGQKLPKGAPAATTYTYLVDKQHRPRRIEWSMGTVSVLATMSDFSRPLKIGAPAAKAIVR